MEMIGFRPGHGQVASHDHGESNDQRDSAAFLDAYQRARGRRWMRLRLAGLNPGR